MPQLSKGVRAPEFRLKDIFPPGFDQISPSPDYTSYHYNLKPEQLCYSLIERYDPNSHVESIVVKSAWYGKGTRSAKREFLVIQIEDTAVEGLINYLVLNRNASDPGQKPSGFVSNFQASYATAKLDDVFRVSYDGDLEKLLRECQLNPYRYLERLDFQTEAPLYLYELVTLAGLVSSRYPHYPTTEASSHLCTRITWECMRLMRPGATYQDGLARKRGRRYPSRYNPESSMLGEVHQSFGDRIAQLELQLNKQRMLWAKLTKANGRSAFPTSP